MVFLGSSWFQVSLELLKTWQCEEGGNQNHSSQMFLKRVNNQVEVYGQPNEMEVTEGTQPRFKRVDSKVITKVIYQRRVYFLMNLNFVPTCAQCRLIF